MSESRDEPQEIDVVVVHVALQAETGNQYAAALAKRIAQICTDDDRRAHVSMTHHRVAILETDG